MKTIATSLMIALVTANAAFAKVPVTGTDVLSDLRGHIENGWYVEGKTPANEACQIAIINYSEKGWEVRMTKNNLETTLASALVIDNFDYTLNEQSESGLMKRYELHVFTKFKVDMLTIEQTNEDDRYLFRLTMRDQKRGTSSCETYNPEFDPQEGD